jgi:acetyl esterase/lipase
MKATIAALALLAFGTYAYAAEPLVLTGIPYVQNGTPDQVMDVYWTAAKPKATVLFIHGGSLKESGDRRTSPAYAHVCEPFVGAGFACASMDYRLAPTNVWPAMPNDVASAVSKLRQLVEERGGDKARIVLFGHSSGCHLAASVGTNPAYLATAGLKPSDLAAIIPMGCTLDREDAALRGLTADRIREPFSKDPEDVATFGTPENWLTANPASHIGPHVPPTLVVVARAERFMPPVLEQGSRFVRRLLELNVAADLVLVPGKHMSSIANLNKPGDPTFAAILAFITHPVPAGSN